MTRRVRTHAHALYATVGSVKHFKPQTVLFHDLTLFRNAARQFTHQAGNRRRFFTFWTYAQQLTEAINIHIPGHDERLFAFPYDFFVFLANPALPAKGVQELIKDKKLIKAFSLDDPTAFAPPVSTGAHGAWFERPIPNRAEYVKAAEEVKASVST